MINDSGPRVSEYTDMRRRRAEFVWVSVFVDLRSTLHGPRGLGHVWGSKSLRRPHEIRPHLTLFKYGPFINRMKFHKTSSEFRLAK